MGAPVRRARAVRRPALAIAAAALLLPGVALCAATHTLIVSGLGGEPEYERRFREQATALAAAARKMSGDPSLVTTLIGSQARADAVREALRSLAEKVGEDDDVLVVLIGHGSFDGEEYRFNLPGPDLTGSQWAALFDALPARRQLIVNATSASGAVAERWRKDNRVVITATKSGGERTATRFAEYWIEAATTPAADLDKDEVVTAAEAFEYASNKVAESFKSAVLLATEHARLEGAGADRFPVARFGVAAIRTTDPALKAMLAERIGIERELAAIRERRDALGEEAYYDELEAALVRLARLQRRIDAHQVAAPTPGGT